VFRAEVGTGPVDAAIAICTVIPYISRNVTMSETTYTLAHFAALCDQVASSREPVIIRRRGAEDVALVSAAELRGLMETAHLLRSPKNAQRLITALGRARGDDLPAETVETVSGWDRPQGRSAGPGAGGGRRPHQALFPEA
jgi:antitoxin YefM